MKATAPVLSACLATAFFPLAASAQLPLRAESALAEAWANDFNIVEEPTAKVVLVLVRDGVKHEIHDVTSMRVSGPLLVIEYNGTGATPPATPRHAVIAATDVLCIEERES